MDNAELLTTFQAAERAGVSRNLLALLRTRGTGPRYTKVAGRVSYRTDDLDEWAHRYWAAVRPEAGLVSPGEAAAMIGVSQETVGRMAQDGRLTVVPSLRGRQYRRSEVEEIARHRSRREGMLGFPQVAQLAGVTEHTVRWHVCRGTGPAGEHIAGRWFATEEAVREWIAGRGRNAHPDRERVNSEVAAEMLGIDPVVLRRMRRSGQGPRFERVGGRVFYRIGDITRWTLSNETSELRKSTSPTSPMEDLAHLLGL